MGLHWELNSKFQVERIVIDDSNMITGASRR